MATEICITLEDDGSFTVDAEAREQESAEAEAPSETEQKFKTADEALNAAKQMLDAASMNPADQGGMDTENPTEAAAPGEEEDAMSASYAPRR